MPKKKQKKKVDVIEVECNSWDCEGGGFFRYKGRLPDTCPYGHLLLTGTATEKTLSYYDKDEIDIEKGGCVSPRPAWNKGRQDEIRDRASSPGGTIYCQICNEEIEVNSDGEEEWESRSGKLHKTIPHTDHYYSPSRGIGGDWIERKRKLKSDSTYISASESEKKRLKKETFNASPLRTAHMMCNCSRPKS